MVPTIAITELETLTGISEATPSCYQKFDLIRTPALNQLQDGLATIRVTNPNAHTFTISQRTIVAYVKILTPGQASHVRPMSLEQLTLVCSYPDEATSVNNHLIQSPRVPTTDRDGTRRLRRAEIQPAQQHRKTHLRRNPQAT